MMMHRIQRNLAVGLIVGGSFACPGVFERAALGDALPIPAHHVVASRHYEIVTDLPAREVSDLAAHMDAVHSAYRRMFASFHPRAATPVRLYLWSTRDRFIEHGAALGAAWDASGGVFFVRGHEVGVSTWVRDQSRSWLIQVLQHEGFHQFAHSYLGPTLPLWANEGLAVYFEHALLTRREQVQGVVPGHRVDLLRHAIEVGQHFPVQELMAITSDRWRAVMRAGDGRGSVMYTQAWALVHFLIHAEDGRYKAAFEEYLRAIAGGITHERAFEHAFRTTDTGAFERRWLAYVAQMEPDPIAEAAERLEFMAAGVGWLLADHGVRVNDQHDLKQQLRRRGFRIIRAIDGVRRVLEPTDEMFEAPAASDLTTRGRRAAQRPRLEVVPGQMVRGWGQLPPRFIVRGLRVTVGVVWSVDGDGRLHHEIVYE